MVEGEGNEWLASLGEIKQEERERIGVVQFLGAAEEFINVTLFADDTPLVARQETDFSRHSVRLLATPPPLFFSSIFFSLPIFVLFGLITLIGTDTAMRTLGLIPALTCLVDKSPANWDVTREGPSRSSQEVPSQKKVAAFDIDSCRTTRLASRLKSLRVTAERWHNLSSQSEMCFFIRYCRPTCWIYRVTF